MHPSAHQFLDTISGTLAFRRRVCELGSRSVNGSIRDLFTAADTYLGIDLQPGPGVDVVTDAADWRPPPGQSFDTVVSCEVLEHANRAEDICKTAYAVLEPGGVFLVTAASDPREPHSGTDGGPLKEGEFYRNVSRDDLSAWLVDFSVTLISTQTAGDIYALAVKA